MKTKILRGDALAMLGTLEDASFDAAFCDPPYGLTANKKGGSGPASVNLNSPAGRARVTTGFMGMAWDGTVPGADVWREVLRVLKPGAPLLAFGGTRTYHRLACAIEDAGFAISDTLCWLHGQGFPKGHAQLKPAWEPITLAWKKGGRALNIDACRIGLNGEPSPTIHRRTYGFTPNEEKAAESQARGKLRNRTDPARRGAVHPSDALGRWPANVLLDRESAAALDAQSGVSTSKKSMRGIGLTRSNQKVYGKGDPNYDTERGHDDSGGASRFFYCAKASKRERGDGNTHPTVKPLKLTEYLARLVLPPANGEARRILIPYSGSGSEMIGARAAGWDFALGIEIDREYAAIATRRLRALKAAA